MIHFYKDAIQLHLMLLVEKSDLTQPRKAQQRLISACPFAKSSDELPRYWTAMATLTLADELIKSDMFGARYDSPDGDEIIAEASRIIEAMESFETL